MKKHNFRLLAIILAISISLSCMLFSLNIAAAEDPQYSYDAEVTVDIPMRADAWVKDIHANDTPSFDIYEMQMPSMSGEGTQAYLNFKSTANLSENTWVRWVPYEDAESKTLFDYSKISRIEVTANYNNQWPHYVHCMRNDNLRFYINGAQMGTTPSARIMDPTTESVFTTQWDSALKFEPTDYDMSSLTATSVIKIVYSFGYWNETTASVVEEVYVIDEQTEHLLYTAYKPGTNFYLHPSINIYGTSIDYDLLSMKVTYTKHVDVTDQVQEIAAKYPVLQGLNSIADITDVNAATVANEVKHFKEEFATLDTGLQDILIDAGVYDEEKLDAYNQVAVHLKNGIVGQFFDKDMVTTATNVVTNIDEMWQQKETGRVVNIQNGKYLLTNKYFGMVEGLSAAPRSMVMKFEFADGTAEDIAAGIRFRYAAPLEDTGAVNNYGQLYLPVERQGDRLVVVSKSFQEFQANAMKINSTDNVGVWLGNKHIDYPTENPIIVAEYVDGVYTPNLITIQFDWLLNAARTHYYLRISISDNHNSVTVDADGCTMPVEAKRFDLDFMCLTYTNNNVYKIPTNFPRLDSVEYHLKNYGLTAPTVDGARFKDPTLGVQDISYQISYDNSAPLPDGYSAVAYGAALMTEQKLVNPYDIIDLYYRGEGDLPVLTAQKVLAAGESVPDTYLVSVKDSASRISGSDADIRGVRFAIVAYVMYTDAQGNLICVYSFNNNDKAVSYGQVSKSVTGVAKQIAANEIANMQGKEGAAEAEEINAIEAILAKAQTTPEEKDTLIAFVGKYTQFIQQ